MDKTLKSLAASNDDSNDVAMLEVDNQRCYVVEAGGEEVEENCVVRCNHEGGCDGFTGGSGCTVETGTREKISGDEMPGSTAMEHEVGVNNATSSSSVVSSSLLFPHSASTSPPCENRTDTTSVDPCLNGSVERRRAVDDDEGRCEGGVVIVTALPTVDYWNAAGSSAANLSIMKQTVFQRPKTANNALAASEQGSNQTIGSRYSTSSDSSIPVSSYPICPPGNSANVSRSFSTHLVEASVHHSSGDPTTHFCQTQLYLNPEHSNRINRDLSGLTDFEGETVKREGDEHGGVDTLNGEELNQALCAMTNSEVFSSVPSPPAILSLPVVLPLPTAVTSSLMMDKVMSGSDQLSLYKTPFPSYLSSQPVVPQPKLPSQAFLIDLPVGPLQTSPALSLQPSSLSQPRLPLPRTSALPELSPSQTLPLPLLASPADPPSSQILPASLGPQMLLPILPPPPTAKKFATVEYASPESVRLNFQSSTSSSPSAKLTQRPTATHFKAERNDYRMLCNRDGGGVTGEEEMSVADDHASFTRLLEPSRGGGGGSTSEGEGRESPTVRLSFKRRKHQVTSGNGEERVESGSSGTIGTGGRLRYSLIREGEVKLCKIRRDVSWVVRRLMAAGCLRTWEVHYLRVEETQIFSEMWNRCMDSSINYSEIENVRLLTDWDTKKTFHVCILVADCILVLQRCVERFANLKINSLSPDRLVTEIKSLVDLTVKSPLHDDRIEDFALDVVSNLLKEDRETQGLLGRDDVIASLAPLLDAGQTTQRVCEFFKTHSTCSLHARQLLDLYAPVVYRILKHNIDFGRYPGKRSFIEQYALTLRAQKEGQAAVHNFIKSAHGPSSLCPHLRILPNLMSVCVSTVYSHYEEKRRNQLQQLRDTSDKSLTSASNHRHEMSELDQKLLTYISMLHSMSEFADWRLQMACLLQPIPFPDDALRDPIFTSHLKPVITNIGDDSRCDVHSSVLSIREGKDGWFEMYCPGGIAGDNHGEVYAIMLRRLIGCCCRRKKFLQNRLQMINSWQLLALREDTSAVETLCAVLEYDICDSEEVKQQLVTTLQSTTKGQAAHEELCKRQILLQEIQQKGGPKKMTLPSRSTDVDLYKLLCSGSFGNLECLSLAFTHVTSACAVDIIKLPALRYLNLWCTQFGDAGLLLLSEHMHRLQVLNLCETPVTDKGLRCLSALKCLRKLNLNSTRLTASTFDVLRENLPVLEEYDIRYTDAW